MISKSNRYLLGLLLAFVPAAICAQRVRPRNVAVGDTVITSTGDTVVTMRPNYGRIPVDVSQGETTTTPTALPSNMDSIIAHAVNLGVQRALASQGVHSAVDNRPRTKAEQLWDRSQKKRKIERVPRESLKATFVPKGQWMIGGTVNFSEWKTDNYNLLVLKNVDIEGHTFSGSPYFGYFVANNLCIGGRYNYTRNYMYLGKFDLNLGEDFNISLEDLYYLGHTHTADFFVRPYLPLGKSNVFGAFCEIRGGYAHSTSKNSTGSGVDYDGSFTKAHTVQLQVCPGMSVFATDFLAVEASIGIMGIKYRWVDQKTNQVETGRVRSGGANFRFNFLSINIGLTFYL